MLNNQPQRFPTLYYLIQSTLTFYNSLPSCTIICDVLQLSTILYIQRRRFTTLCFPIHSTSTFYNSPLSYKITLRFYSSLLSCTIIFDVLQLSTLLYNQLRRFTTLYYLIQSTLTFYNSLLSCTIICDVFQLSIILYNHLQRFTDLYYLIQST